MKDPNNEETREYQAEHLRKFSFDLAAICKALKEQSRKLKAGRLPANRTKPGSRSQTR
ncbi:MAG: hypothetical protein JSW66_06855 [Phycisphaerales bacterium]|nr:MAG: hypothetical protein JSW66_06855 [Phycisphaerales bacterium]